MGDHVDPQPRRVALGDAALEQLDLRRDLGVDGVERLAQQFEPGELGVAQVDDHAGALRHLDSGLAHRVLEPRRPRVLRLLGIALGHVPSFRRANPNKFDSPRNTDLHKIRPSP